MLSQRIVLYQQALGQGEMVIGHVEHHTAKLPNSSQLAPTAT
jgi:hypothetical protein